MNRHTVRNNGFQRQSLFLIPVLCCLVYSTVLVLGFPDVPAICGACRKPSPSTITVRSHYWENNPAGNTAVSVSAAPRKPLAKQKSSPADAAAIRIPADGCTILHTASNHLWGRPLDTALVQCVFPVIRAFSMWLGVRHSSLPHIRRHAISRRRVVLIGPPNKRDIIRAE